MALKLGKCRLCLKLGDFYSIFTMDNNLQLAEMVMECARVKIYDGDGLPDKICSECIQKLSSAHIFKQQCERSDQELRRNYVPPPGFSSPTPPNRQSSDSAFSSQTEVSKPSSTFENKVTPVSRSRKRSGDSIDDASISSRSHDYRPGSSKRVDELRMSQKKPRLSMNSDSDYDDNSASFYSAETDSDEPLLHKCKQCGKAFRTHISLSAHMKCHKRKNVLKNLSFESPKEIKDATDEEDKLSCDKCGKQFKLKIMLKRHHDICGKSPRKELMVSLEPIDAVQQVAKIDCQMCTTKFKTIENLEKHMRVVHAAVLKRDNSMNNENGKICVPCLYCGQPFDDYYIHSAHFNMCPQKNNLATFECPVCTKVITKKGCYFLHIKAHFFPLSSNKSLQEITSKQENFQCRMCNKKLSSQDTLITHLAAHMSNIDEADEGGDEESRASTIDDSASVHSEYSSNVSSGPLKCKTCDKSFKYKKSLLTHEEKHSNDGKIKIEPPDGNNSTDLLNETTKSMNHYESESSQDEGEEDNTCDICEKQFSYKRLLLQHKRTKHPMTSGFKRAKINLKNCSVRCLICDIEMKVSAINEHNQTHISVNIKPRNLYTCMECEEQFKSCSALANHIKIIHRLKQQPSKINAPPADLADFCEVVVTKAEPLDELQSHNGFGEVSAKNGSPSVNMSGFTCPICNKQLPTLISLKRHVNWHNHVGKSMEKKLECFVCKETFRFQCHYKIHMREHYNDTNLDPKLLTCSICNRKSKHLRAAQAHMNYHKQTRFQNKDYECSICKRVFQHRKVYLSHMAIHYKRGESANNTIVGYVLPNSVDKNKFDGTHTCHHCGKICDSENSLKHHIRWHNSKTSLFGARYECHICNLQFTNKRRLELHTRTHYEDDNGPYKCNICGKGYIDEDYYKRHVKGHNFDHQSHKKRIEKLRKNKVKCPICARYYPDLVKLIRHLRRTHPESKMIKEDPDAPPPNYYSCKLCAKVFLDERRLQFHEEAHLRKPEFYKCKFCGKKTISLKNHRIHIKGHLTQKYIDNPLKCPHCAETFMRGYDLHYHLRDAHDINETWIEERRNQTLDGPLKELQCSICFKVLASKGNFERHIDYHNSLRCNYCFDYFSSLRFLEGHLAFSCDKKKLIGDTEIYPKKVKCHVCYKAFHLQVKLDCHLRTQHEIKTFKKACEGKQEIVCDYCFKVFENEYALSTHKIYHRTVGYYGCIYCNRKFNTMTLYRKHKNHHFSQLNVDNPTKCEHCDETFVAFREMIYHMRDVHGDDKEWIVLPKESIEEKCDICQKTFFNLHRHLDYHEENRCKKCGEYFFSRADYDNHLCAIDSDEEVTETNTNGVRPVYEECSFCFKPVTRKNSKRLHDQIHRGSGSISCRFCSLKFKTMDAFNIHAFSHRSRKYKKKPIKCRKCGEQFVKYGPFIKHMKIVHKCSKKLHYRATVMPEKCIVCHEDFPNLHNHYRAHLQNQCQQCFKYFTSSKVFSLHDCDKEDSDPSKVFICDANLPALINSYVPKDEKDDEKYYGHEEEGEEEEEEMVNQEQEIATQDEDSQNSIDIDEGNVHDMVHAPIISDVLSLFKKKEVNSKCNVENDGQSSVSGNIVVLTDDDSIGFEENVPVITIDD
ncbi:zinc finger protein 729-like [Vanessa atalanta]|uniref:zinc finger protein 729-like n=1 Tax=Vanessa atalanta TaxID=42275 RepID=UPI001FCE24E6|nr:zinc finger protein 729-like [Vanessa atalanta]XP_047536072.1 zinc finger protein 729-like [Vanessa atalanta]